MKVIRKRLYEDEGLPDNIRYSEDCDCVEYRIGDEWVEREEFDPRYGVGFRAPPLDTSDPKCDAAAGMVFLIEETVNATLAAASIIDLANTLFALIVILNPGFGILVKIFVAIAEALFALGTAALTLSFDSEAYELLTCIFYDEIGEDGQMSQTQLEVINTRVCAEMDVTVCAVIGLVLNNYGPVGMSNAGTLLEQTGDCEDCVDICPIWIFDGTAAGWGYDPEQALGAFVQTGTGLRVNSGFGSDIAAGDRTTLTVPTGCTLTGINFTTTGTLGYAPSGHVEAYLGTSRGESGAMLLYTDAISAGVHSYSRTIVGSGQTIYFGLGAIDNDTVARITRAEVTYTGDKPVFTGGSECP